MAFISQNRCISELLVLFDDTISYIVKEILVFEPSGKGMAVKDLTVNDV